MIKLKIKSPNSLIEFMKKFSIMDKQVLMEIENEELKCKYSTIEKTMVKSSKIKLSDIFTWSEELPKRNLKIGIYNIDKLINSFKQFSFTGDTFFNIQFTEINSEFVAQEIFLESSDLEMNFPCSSLSMFKYQLTDDIMNKVLNTSENLLNFPLSKETQSKMLSLLSFDSDNDILTFISNSKGIRIKGKSFNFEISNQPNVDLTSKVGKDFLMKLDKENYNVFVMNKKLVFISTESESGCVISNPSE